MDCFYTFILAFQKKQSQRKVNCNFRKKYKFRQRKMPAGAMSEIYRTGRDSIGLKYDKIYQRAVIG